MDSEAEHVTKRNKETKMQTGSELLKLTMIIDYTKLLSLSYIDLKIQRLVNFSTSVLVCVKNVGLLGIQGQKRAEKMFYTL